MEDALGLGAAVGGIAELADKAAKLDLLSFTPPTDAKGLVPFVFAYDHVDAGLHDLRPLAEEWRVHPERRKGTANVSTLGSFIELVKRHATEHSVIFASAKWPNPSLTAVIDYHEKDNGKPAFGQHRVFYPFPVTAEFEAWLNHNGTVMQQQAFATFVEERIAEI